MGATIGALRTGSSLLPRELSEQHLRPRVWMPCKVLPGACIQSSGAGRAPGAKGTGNRKNENGWPRFGCHGAQGICLSGLDSRFVEERTNVFVDAVLDSRLN